MKTPSPAGEGWGDDCMDAGGRATHGAVAEEIKINYLSPSHPNPFGTAQGRLLCQGSRSRQESVYVGRAVRAITYKAKARTARPTRNIRVSGTAAREKNFSGQHCPNQQQGFTLLEILIALAIFAVMSMMAYAGLAAVLNARAATEPRSQQMAQLQTTMYLLNEDLSQAINRPIRDELGSTEPAFSGGRGNEILVFTRSVPTWSGNGAADSLHRVSYRFENGALYRQVWTLPDRTRQTQYRRRKLMTAEQVSIKFYSEESQTWLPFNGSGGSPDALEISFNLTGLGSIQRSFLLHQ